MAPYPPIPSANGKDFTKTTHHDTYPEINPATESDHTDHYIFITGASKGVGLASAISYAKAGAKGIALGARSDLETAKQEVLAAAKSAGKAAPQILTFKLDVTKWEEVSQAALETENEFGRLDILLNNAGYLSEFTPIVDSDPEEWWSNYEVNLKGVYLPTKAFLPLMLKGGEKTIVNVGSTGAHALTPGGSGYQNTKFALLRFTEYIMVEYGERGILAYCINPGAILTLLASKTPIEYRYMFNDTAEMASDSIVFLTTEKREWLAGRYMSCNWDMPEFISKKEEIENTDKLRVRMIV